MMNSDFIGDHVSQIGSVQLSLFSNRNNKIVLEKQTKNTMINFFITYFNVINIALRAIFDSA